MKLLRRARYRLGTFLAFVWRPIYPTSDCTWFENHIKHTISIRCAWDLSGDVLNAAKRAAEKGESNATL